MGPPPGDDLELVREARAGDGSAFGELVRRHQARVLGLCAAMLRDPGRAEDAAQDVFLKAYRSLGAFRGESSFATWLHRIAANRCLDLLRAESRREALPLEAAEARPAPSPDSEGRDLLERALAALPPDYRLILVLREVQGLSYEEAAEAMECSLDSVKARLRRAREALEERLRHFSGGADV